jgi:hypothetical protein
MDIMQARNPLFEIKVSLKDKNEDTKHEISR